MKTPVAFDFILLAMLWGSSFLLQKYAVTDFGPFVMAFLRVLMASLLLMPLLALRGQMGVLRSNWKPILFVGMINSGIPFVLFAFAVLHISTGLTSILNATVPLWGAVVAWLWLGDKPNASRTLGLLIGFCGVAALSWSKASFSALFADTAGSASGWAVIACLVATLSYGIAASFTKKRLVGVPPMASAAGSQLGASILLIVPALMTIPVNTPTVTAWIALILLAGLSTALAYILYFRIIERIGPARTVTVTFLIPVFGVLFGHLFLGEIVTGTMLLWGAVILLGTALATGVLKLPGKR